MAARTRKGVAPRVAAKARTLLAFSEEKAREGADSVELFNAIFGKGGKANELFVTPYEREAFTKTDESERIYALFDQVPSPAAVDVGDLRNALNGNISLSVPRTLYTALVAEARAEGVSLEQLCVAKLVAQLRKAV